MLKFWNKIINIGTGHYTDPEMIRRVSLVNQFSILAFSGFFFNGLNDLFLGEYYSAYLLLIFGLIQLLVPLLNHYGKAVASSFFMIFSINLALFYFDSYGGYDCGTFLYYFPVIMAITLLYNVRKYKTKYIVHTIVTLTFLIINMLTHRDLFANYSLSTEARHQMFIYNCVTAVLITSFILHVIGKANNRVKIELEQMIERRIQTEEQLTVSLKEKEILLAEVHHRVKNNLAVITSLLNLKMNNVTNSHTKNVLLDCRNRVVSMSIIHEKLYRSNSFDKINIRQYVLELMEEIQYSYPAPNKNIEIKINCSDIYLDLTAAIPCGLILNELITNAYKYAFKEDQKGFITISLKQNNGSVVLEVADNGAGFDLSTAQENAESLGLMLIESLTEQLDGEGGYDLSKGTTYKMSFPSK